MTIRDLLRHTAGFTYGFHNRTPVDAAYRKLRIAEMDSEGGLEHMIAQLAALPLEYAPGEAWIYSVATDVVGYLVQLVSGQDYADFVRQHILTPLKMADTDFVVPRAKADRFAACYLLQPTGLQVFDAYPNEKYFDPPKLQSGGGGLAGTAGDYLRFCRMLLNQGELDGVRLLSPETVAMMTSQSIAKRGPNRRSFAGRRRLQRERLSRHRLWAGRGGYAGPKKGGHSRHGGRIRLGRHGLDRFLRRSQRRHGGGVHDPGDLRHCAPRQTAPRAAYIDLRRDDGSQCLKNCLLLTGTGPYDAALKARAVAALEQGAVLFFPSLPFSFEWKTKRSFWMRSVSDGKAKNISLNPATGTLQATTLTGEKRAALAAMIERFGSSAAALVHELLPYRNVERARTSFPPGAGERPQLFQDQR